MEKERLTKNELNNKVKYYHELYPIVHLYDEQQLKNKSLLSSTKKAYQEKKDCSQFEFHNGQFLYVLSKYYHIENEIYIIELIRDLDEQLIMSKEDKNSILIQYLGYYDDLYIDVLSGAYNRRYYEERIKYLTNPAGIVMIDIDDFKIYNDTYGHDFGDEVIKLIVEKIKSYIQPKDVLIRYGGDEFLIYSPYAQYDEFKKMMQNIINGIHQSTIKGYESISFSISAGVVIHQEGLIEKSVSFADHLLYHAKKKKNRMYTQFDHINKKDLNEDKPRVLIVDDSSFNRDILSDILKDEFQVIEAKDGKECMTCVETYGPSLSLILLDIIMPEMNGFEVLQWLQQKEWLIHIPVILISSEDSPETISKGFELGASDYIPRPFDFRIVYRRVNNIIKLYAKQKRLMDLLKNKR